MKKIAIIIGAGPAGLTAAYELLTRTDIKPIILEKSEIIGGISRTTQYKGNRMDMGPHRFFSKSDRVMNWWFNIMPLENTDGEKRTITYQNKSREISNSGKEENSDKVMLLIHRLTRIYFLRNFFSYPIKLSYETLKTLGPICSIKILSSYIWSKIHPIKKETSLEDFLINRFGNQLYLLFFKDYTEKVWGRPCNQISAEWGAQRIKGVSLYKAIMHAIKSLKVAGKGNELQSKKTETSLIETFLYPKYGPGSLWEEVANQIIEMGGEIVINQEVSKINIEGKSIVAVETIDKITNKKTNWKGDYFFSTMPVKELINSFNTDVPADVKTVADGLQYRDFINVGILLKRLSSASKNSNSRNTIHLKDNWIYIQEKDVKVGRLMIYNNWGNGMVNDPNTTWIGMEYFCNKEDNLWSKSDTELKEQAIYELENMDLCSIEDVLDSTVQRMEKTYPAYFGTYIQFDTVKSYTDSFSNLFLVGRNGMHKYNNADHSMLTAMTAVDNIIAEKLDKSNIWAINTEQEYHEEKKINEVEIGTNPASQTYSLSGFKSYLFEKKYPILFFIIFYILEWLVFKRIFPYANYMPDSYSYIDAASTNTDVNMWPVAYSKFLRLISVFTHSDSILTGIQFLFLQICSSIFILTALYIFHPGKIAKSLIILLVLINPTTLFISNYISSDALFISFSLLWFSTLIWILINPSYKLLIFHGIMLLACFNLRHTAIIYPVISIISILLSPSKWPVTWLGITFGTSLVILSIIFTSGEMQKVTGQKQYSAFGGWQLANNALFMYEHIPPQSRKPLPKEFQKLELMVEKNIDTIKKVNLSHEDSLYTFFYLWSPNSPLVQYMDNQWQKSDSITHFKKWASEGPLYSSYALRLIRNYPLQYVQYFMIPNLYKYLIPPTEFLGIYNMNEDTVGKLAKGWFNYKSQVINSKKNKHSIIEIVKYQSIISALVNVLFLICFAGLLFFNMIKSAPGNIKKTFLLMLAFWIINIVFSTFASPIVLRYVVFPTIICLTNSIIVIEYIYKGVSQKEKEIRLTI